MGGEKGMREFAFENENSFCNILKIDSNIKQEKRKD